MNKNKIQIEINNRSFKKDMVYVSLAFRGGFSTRHFLIDNKKHFISNLAFFNVFCRYIEANSNLIGLHYDVERASTTISFADRQSDVIGKLGKVIECLFNMECDEDAFHHAKQTAKKAFADRYKDGAFRARYKAYEFSDLHKRFTLKSLINDIEQFDYESFQTCIRMLIVPDNICVYISGEVELSSFEEIRFPDMSPAEDHTVRIAGYEYDGFLRQEAHITNIAREDCNVIIEAVDFFNKEITNFTKLIISEMTAEMIGQMNIDVWVDSLDASIIFETQDLRRYKDQLYITDEETFNSAKERLLKRYLVLSENNPEHFAIRASSLMTVGIYVDQYLEFIDKCSFDMYAEIAEKADYKITEAQVVLGKESI